MPQDRAFDVIVVGSGPGGGIASYALTKAGAKVALVEAGRRLRPGVDYNAHADVYANLEKRLKAGKMRPVSSVWSDFAEKNHFVGVGDRPAHGQLRVLGGRSVCWAGHTLRFGPLDYKSWPISYDEAAPYYDRAERLMLVHGERNGLSNLPDGVFQKHVPLRAPERRLKTGVMRLKAAGREMDFVPMRKAMPTDKGTLRRPICHYCGHCMEGCEVDSKYTSANTPIPMAMATGNLTLLTESMMTRILSRDGRITGIEYVDAQGRNVEIRCKVLVLSCSAVETARHLLYNGLANSSGLAGRNLTSHFGLTVSGVFDDLRTRNASNDDGTDYYHSLLTGMYWDKPSKKFEGTYQVQCGAGVHPYRLHVPDPPGFGVSFKRELKEINAAHTSMNMQGMLLPSSGKFVDLDSERKDRFGIPLPRVHLHYEDSDVAMAQDMVNTSEEIIRAAGGKVLRTPGEVTTQKLVIDSNHWVGTARMGKDPRTSVVNTAGQSHDIPNLFIGDASVFAAYPEKNPTLTNIALTWRMSDLLTEKMRKKEI